MPDKKAICFNCGAKMVEYKFGLNKGLCRVLWKIAQLSMDDWVFIRDCKLTNSMYGNQPKLDHWGFTQRDRTEEKGGKVRLTDKGRKFLMGECTASKYVVTYRNDVVRYEGPQLLITDVTDGWAYIPEYKEQARTQIQGGAI